MRRAERIAETCRLFLGLQRIRLRARLDEVARTDEVATTRSSSKRLRTTVALR
jgi:hypothetical protein